MWIPESAAELEAAVRQGSLEEGSQLDFKKELPNKGGNADIAVDVSALTVDGGMLVYGVGEDENKRPTQLTPIELAGAPERVDQVARTSVNEPPVIRTLSLPLADDPARGYLLVIVPPSSRAPHQVVVSGKYQYRYYGRGATGNRVLTEPEIARLYARRQLWSFDRREHLKSIIDSAPFEENADLAYLHAFARPVVIDEDLWVRSAGEDPIALQRQMFQAAQRPNQGAGSDSALAGAASWTRHGADTWRLSREHNDDPQYCVRCDIGFDGSARLFCGRVGARPSPRPHESGQPGQLAIFERLVAGSLASFFALIGEFYTAASYVGPVDIGVALTGIQGACAVSMSQVINRREQGYGEAAYRTDLQVNAESLDQPRDLTRRILSRFFDALVRPGYDPFGG